MAGNPGRILLVKPSALGDVCRSMPILASLRAAFPAAKIDWLVQDDFEAAVQGHPALERVVAFPRRAWKRWWMPRVVSQVHRFRGTLRAANLPTPPLTHPFRNAATASSVRARLSSAVPLVE
jgi:ADP-heptose:LPS heptosyltransferase